MLITPTELTKRWRLQPDTVLHVGAHQGEELDAYEILKWGAERTVWVEAIPELAIELSQLLSSRHNHRVVNSVAWDKVEDVTFRVANSTQSSSALPMKRHSSEYPSIVEASTFVTRAEPLEDSLRGDPILSRIDFLNLDIQGAELRALRGLGAALESVRAIYSEINIVELYEGCATVRPLSAFLRANNFVLVDIKLTSAGWGDALWLRRAEVALPTRALRGIHIQGQLASARLRWLRKLFMKQFPQFRVVARFRDAIQSALFRRILNSPTSNRIMMLRRLNESVGRGFNGGIEAEVAQLLQIAHLPDSPIVLDIGANLGDWTCEIRTRIPDSVVYCFEPSRSTFEVLRERLRNDKQVVPVPLAVSDTKGSAVLFSDAPESGLASLHQRDLDRFGLVLSRRETIEKVRLDDWCSTNEVIPDVIKIDVEGHEFAVLEGGRQTLTRVRAVHFKCGGTWINSSVWFRDVWNLLTPLGFRIFRIAPSGPIQIKSYAEEHECFLYQNFIALRS